MLTIRTPSFSSLGLLSDQMDRFFDSGPTPMLRPARAGLRPAPFPALDVCEDETGYTVRADLPGFEPGVIDISVEEDLLTIKGERVAPACAESARVHHTERPFGAFERAVRLPAPVNSESVTASFDAGVLTITLPKPAEQRPRRVPIRTA